MSVTKIINIKVNDGDLKDLEKDLSKVGNQFDKVDNEAKKASTSIKDVGDNGGAIALLDELTGGLATKVRDAAEASKLFSFNLKGVRTALIATGIGAFVVSLGLIVAYWDDIVGYITGANKELENQIQLQQDLVDEKQRELDILDGQDNILKLQGKTQQQINKLKKDALQLVIREQQKSLILEQQRLAELEEIQKGGGSALESFFKTGFNLLVGFGQMVDSVFAKLGLNTEFAESASGTSASLLESIFGTEEEINQATENVKRIEDEILKAQNRLAGLELSDIEAARNQVDRPRNIESVDSVSAGEIIDPKQTPRFQNEKNLIDAIDQLREGSANDEIIRAELVANAKRDIAMNTLSLIGALAEEGSEIGKGVALAQTVIAGIEGVQNAYKTAQASPITVAFPAYPLIQAGLAGAFSAVQIKRILSTDPTGRTTPNLGGGNVGGAGTGAPSFNVVGQSGVNQLAQSLGQDQQPIQAFVVGSQVTTQQELDNNIVQTASIGG